MTPESINSCLSQSIQSLVNLKACIDKKKRNESIDAIVAYLENLKERVREE